MRRLPIPYNNEKLPDANAMRLPRAKRQMASRRFGYSRLVEWTTETRHFDNCFWSLMMSCLFNFYHVLKFIFLQVYLSVLHRSFSLSLSIYLSDCPSDQILSVSICLSLFCFSLVSKINRTVNEPTTFWSPRKLKLECLKY